MRATRNKSGQKIIVSLTDAEALDVLHFAIAGPGKEGDQSIDTKLAQVLGEVLLGGGIGDA